MKIKNIALLTLSVLFLVACGNENDDTSNKTNTKRSAQEILQGRTLYSADEDLEETTGYYQDIYAATRIIESEHAEDGTQIGESDILQVQYNADKITVSFENESIICSVVSLTNAVQFTCDDGSEFVQWESIDKIQRVHKSSFF